MESAAAWGAGLEPDVAPLPWAVHEAPPTWERPRLRYIAGDGLEAPWRGRGRCAVCDVAGGPLRELRFAARPWADSYTRLPRYALVHYSCAVVPDEPLELECPRTWFVRPLPPSLRLVGPRGPERK